MKAKAKIKALGNIIASNYFNKKTPLCADLTVTYRCNGRCRYCNTYKNAGDEMDTQTTLSLINDLAESGCAHIDICGGEPLIREDIGTIINHIKKRGMLVSVATNGLLVEEKIEDLLPADFVTISLDGPEEIHDEMRGKGSHKKALKAIDTVLKNKMNLMTITVMHTKNIHYLDYIVQLASKKGFKCFFQPMYSNPRYSKSTNEIQCEKGEYEKAIKKLIRMKDTENIAGSRRYLRYILKPQLPFNKCFAGKLYCRIEPDGYIYPCMDKVNHGAGIQYEKGRLKKLFKSLPSVEYKKCKSCICPLNWEYNFMFNLDLRSIIDVTRLLKKRR